MWWLAVPFCSGLSHHSRVSPRMAHHATRRPLCPRTPDSAPGRPGAAGRLGRGLGLGAGRAWALGSSCGPAGVLLEGRGERRPRCGCQRQEARSSRWTRVWGTRPGPCWRGGGRRLPPRWEAWLLCCSACSSLCGPGDRRPRNWTLAASAETRLGLVPDPLRGVWKAQNVAWVAAALGTAVALGPARGCWLWACRGASGRPPLFLGETPMCQLRDRNRRPQLGMWPVDVLVPFQTHWFLNTEI